MQITQGDTFTLALAVQVDGAPQDMTNWSLEAAVFVPFSQSYPLTLEWTDRTAGTYSLSADTSLWPIGQMQMAVTYTTDAAQVLTTNFLPISVGQGIPN